MKGKRKGRVTGAFAVFATVVLVAGCSSGSGTSAPTASAPASAAASAAGACTSSDPAVAAAQAAVVKATAHATAWDGPTSGPKAQAGKSIVYVSADQRNGGALGVSKGVEEAAKAIGWTVRIIDGQGTAAGATQALNQAIALKPDGIILGTVDAVQAKSAISDAVAAGITVVGWHSSSAPGPVADPKLFANITTDPVQVAKTTADYAIAQSCGKAGVVIFTDSVYGIAIVKSTAMQDEIKKCTGCKVLSYEDTPLSDTSTRMGPLTTSLLQKYSTEWTYGLGINDLYFDYASPALESLGVGPAGPPVFVSAGDGSASAYQRIRDGKFQVGTVPEPLNEAGWQAVDEMNRAFAGAAWSGWVAPVHLVTPENIAFDGGANNVFDPDNGYRDQYKKIWGG